MVDTYLSTLQLFHQTNATFRLHKVVHESSGALPHFNFKPLGSLMGSGGEDDLPAFAAEVFNKTATELPRSTSNQYGGSGHDRPASSILMTFSLYAREERIVRVSTPSTKSTSAARKAEKLSVNTKSFQPLVPCTRIINGPAPSP